MEQKRVEKATLKSRSPSTAEKIFDRTFRGSACFFAWLLLVGLLYFVWEISRQAAPAISERGLGFLTGTTWDPNKNEFSILPEIWGTLYTSLIAIVFGTIFGVAVAVFLSEGFLGSFVFWFLKKFDLQFHSFWGNLPTVTENLLKNLVELLAAIPSVVYGLWGIFVVIPLIRPGCDWLHQHLGWISFFDQRLSGPGVLPASLVLGIMILPTISAISRDSLVSIPPKLKEAAYGLGATRWETILTVLLPTSATGIFGGVILGFGRALGETMALAMLVGNANRISVSLFSPANTLSALLANNFGEASIEREIPVLMYAALVLMTITLVVNLIGSLIVQRATRGLKEVR